MIIPELFILDTFENFLEILRWKRARSVKTNKFIVGLKKKARRLFDKPKVLGFKG